MMAYGLGRNIVLINLHSNFLILVLERGRVCKFDSPQNFFGPRQLICVSPHVFYQNKQALLVRHLLSCESECRIKSKSFLMHTIEFLKIILKNSRIFTKYRIQFDFHEHAIQILPTRCYCFNRSQQIPRIQYSLNINSLCTAIL